jgi:thiol-disulfide isomerase/thioredoxin
MTRGGLIAAIAGLVGLCSLAGCLKTQPVTFEPIRFEQWQHQLQSMKGRVVAVDVWATWCAPCIERFPHMVELYRRYKDRGVAFVSMSVDDREDQSAVEAARQFVRRQHATFANYLMDENIMESFEKLGVQGIPAVFVYDRTGRLRYNLNGNDPNRQATLKDVDDALATLVAEK